MVWSCHDNCGSSIPDAIYHPPPLGLGAMGVMSRGNRREDNFHGDIWRALRIVWGGCGPACRQANGPVAGRTWDPGGYGRGPAGVRAAEPERSTKGGVGGAPATGDDVDHKSHCDSLAHAQLEKLEQAVPRRLSRRVGLKAWGVHYKCYVHRTVNMGITINEQASY